MLKIESAHNDTFKKLLSLTGAKGLKKEGLFLLSGEKLIREFLAKPHLKIAYELTAPRMTFLTSLAQADKGTEIVQLSAELFAHIDVLGINFNILVLEQPPMATLTATDLTGYAPQGMELVLPVGDPGNLGALFRSCEAFGVTRVILSQEAAHPFLPKSVKASAGGVLRMPTSCGPLLRDFPSGCIALDMQGIPIDEFTWPANAMLVVGEEGVGLGGTKFRHRVRIPTKTVESLNVVVAASIALANWAGRKR